MTKTIYLQTPKQ